MRKGKMLGKILGIILIVLVVAGSLLGSFVSAGIVMEDAVIETLKNRDNIEAAGSLSKTIYGFWPYWASPQSYQPDWSALTHVAYFCLEPKSDGSLKWKCNNDDTLPSRYGEVRDAAHSHNVKVIMTVQCIYSLALDALDEILAYHQQDLANNICSMLETYDADGVCIDFEYPHHINPFTGGSNKQLIEQLMHVLHDTIKNADSNYHISFCVAHTPETEYRNSNLTQYADAIFLMAYGGAGSWSDYAGPLSPYYANEGTYPGVKWAVNLLKNYYPSNRIILGLPFYGWKWPCSSSAAGASTTGSGWSVRMSTAVLEAKTTTDGRLWDSTSRTPWYRYQSGSIWYQCWYDDEESLGLKFDYVNSANIAGTGFWALGYEGNNANIWNVVKDKFEETCAYPIPTTSASEYQTEIDVGEIDWVKFTVRNDGTEYAPAWGLQVRVSDGLDLVQHSSYAWNQTNMCSSDAAEWWKENDLAVGASDDILVGIRGTTAGSRVVQYTAWMYDADGQPDSVQYSHPKRQVPCDRDYAWYAVTVTCPTPGTPSLMSPSDGLPGVSTTPTLDWSDVFDATSYDVQVCSDSGCTIVVRSANDVGSSQWAVSPALSTGAQYWWRARARNSCGPGSWSNIRSFTTQVSPNTPPNPPSNPSPPNHEPDVSINADLSWSGGDPDAGDTVTYDVYFGTSETPPPVSNDQLGTTYDPGTLAYNNTKYYWKIVATDNHGQSTDGPLWDFTTESAVSGEWKSPSATGDQFNEWVNPTNAYSSDNQYAHCGLAEPQQAYQDYHNFGFSIPSNVIIQGIEVRCEGHTTNPEGNWWILQLSGDGGSTWSTIKYSPAVNLNADTTVYVGGSSDLWGRSWTPSNFSNASFRLKIFPTYLLWTEDPHHLDHIQVKVYSHANNPPNPPSNPSPPNHEPDVSINADLNWSGGDPDAGDTVTYDVYFGTNETPPPISNDQLGTSYDPGTLAYNTTYYWQVVAMDNHGASTTGPLWEFTTALMVGDANMDGVVDTGDITKVKRIYFELDLPTPCADVNGDGLIDTGDITAIKVIYFGT